MPIKEREVGIVVQLLHRPPLDQGQGEASGNRATGSVTLPPPIDQGREGYVITTRGVGSKIRKTPESS